MSRHSRPPQTFDYSSPVGIVLAMEPQFKVGQRVKFEDPDTFDSRIGQGLEARGRIVHADGFLLHDGIVDHFYQVIPDGKTFAIWLSATEIQGE